MFDFKKQAQAIGITSRRLKKGEITRPDVCTKCPNKNNIQAHHPNYNIPEYIIWLCRKCHIKVHREDAKQDRKRRKEILKTRLGNVSSYYNNT